MKVISTDMGGAWSPKMMFSMGTGVADSHLEL